MLGEATSNPLLATSEGTPVMIGVSFTTDGSGVATLLHDHNGQVSIVKATNTYTVTLPGPWTNTQAVVVTHALAATVNHVLTVTPGSATIAIAFSGAVASSRVDLLLLAEVNVG